MALATSFSTPFGDKNTADTESLYTVVAGVDDIAARSAVGSSRKLAVGSTFSAVVFSTKPLDLLFSEGIAFALAVLFAAATPTRSVSE